MLKPFRSNAAYKDFRNAAMKTINLKIGQVSSNVKSIKESTSALCDVLKTSADGDTVKRRFVELALAERFFDEAEVSLRIGNSGRIAWPVAYVATQVFLVAPEVEELCLGYIYRACPYLVPDCEGSHVDQRARAPGPVESVGYARLLLAIKVVQGDLAWVWRWLALTLNARPAPVSVSLLLTVLEMAGAAAQARYGRQFQKLVSYVGSEYVPLLEAERAMLSGGEADKFRADQARLKLWLAEFAKTGRAPPPDGREVKAVEEAELNPNI